MPTGGARGPPGDRGMEPGPGTLHPRRDPRRRSGGTAPAPSPAIELLASGKPVTLSADKQRGRGERRLPPHRPGAGPRALPVPAGAEGRWGGGECEATPPPDSSVINDPPARQGAVAAARAGGGGARRAGAARPGPSAPTGRAVYKRRRGAAPGAAGGGCAGQRRPAPLRTGTVSPSPGRGLSKSPAR